MPAAALTARSSLQARWRVLFCGLCMLVMAVPSAGWLPLGSLLSLRVDCEEDAETVDETDIEATEERRFLAAAPKACACLLPVLRPASSCRPWSSLVASDRSEYRSLNGTGSPLLC